MLVVALYALLKFVWSHRLFGYTAVLMGAMPGAPQDTRCGPRAEKAADLLVGAADHYNRGVRAIHFGIALAAGRLGPIRLMVATAITAAVILRREFFSGTRRVLLDDSDSLRGPEA